jgi:hypothetical protein
MAKISHTKISQPSFGEKKAKINLHQISRFTVIDIFVFFKITLIVLSWYFWRWRQQESSRIYLCINGKFEFYVRLNKNV